MKWVLIGGGSFVFAPTVLEDVIVKHALRGTLVLVDLNLEAAEAMAAAGRRIAAELGVALHVEACADRKEALPGADFVIVSASPQGAKRWMIDFGILTDLGIPDQARECGGVGGLANALRSITLVLDICRDMEELCPEAMLLDVTNPMPRVVTAVERYTSIKCAGFCNIAYRSPEGYGLLGRLLNRDPEDLEVISAGLNHFAWFLSVKDKKTGEDLFPQLHRLVEEESWAEYDEETRRELRVMRRWLQQYGAVAAGAVDHHAEYLPLQEDIRYTVTPPYHGTESERQQRLSELKQVAAGNGDWRDMFSHGSWEHPVDVAVSLARKESAYVDILNVRNRGAIRELPDDRIVEVPVAIQEGTLQPIAVPAFPPKLAELLRAVSDVHELAAEAAAKGDVSLVKRAISRDPAITDQTAAIAAVERMLAAHADLLPQFKQGNP